MAIFFYIWYNENGVIIMDNIEAVVFDMDGLMFDTEKLWLDSVIKTNEVYKYKVPTSLIIECMGKRKDAIDAKLKEEMGEGFDPDEFRRLKKKFMAQEVLENGLQIKKGLKELISFLKSKNIKIAIASSSSFEKIHTRFGEANLDIKVFDYIIGGDMVTIPKPDSQIYLKSCEVLNVKPENAIALEDSDSGIKAAASAGMKAILIPDIKEPSEETVRLAYKKLDNLLEVIDLWK